MARILVTGSEGNIGSYLVPYLRCFHHEVACVDICNRYRDDYTMADVRRSGDMHALFHNFQPNIVLHMAAVVSRVTAEASPLLTVDTNVTGVNNMVHLCVLHGAKLVYFSSSEVYGNVGGLLHEQQQLHPNNLYGLTKLMGETLVLYATKTWGLKASIWRPFMLYADDETRGDHRSAMVRFAEALVRGEPVQVHRGAKRSWLHMRDGVEIMRRLLLSEVDVVNIGHPEAVSMMDIATEMCRQLERPLDLISEVPLPERMTLVKYPSLHRQNAETGYKEFIPVKQGIVGLLARMREELCLPS